jgi:hypothetical protein
MALDKNVFLAALGLLATTACDELTEKCGQGGSGSVTCSDTGSTPTTEVPPTKDTDTTETPVTTYTGSYSYITN